MLSDPHDCRHIRWQITRYADTAFELHQMYVWYVQAFADDQNKQDPKIVLQP